MIYNSRYFAFWALLLSFGVAALTVGASRSSEWIFCALVLGPSMWVAFGGPSYIRRWHKHRMPIVRGLVFVLSLAFFFAMLKYGYPWSVALLDGILQN